MATPLLRLVLLDSDTLGFGSRAGWGTLFHGAALLYGGCFRKQLARRTCWLRWGGQSVHVFPLAIPHPARSYSPRTARQRGGGTGSCLWWPQEDLTFM